VLQTERGLERSGEQMKTWEFILIALASGITFPICAYFILKSWDENIWKE